MRVGVVGPGVMGGHHIAVWQQLGVDVCAYAPGAETRDAARRSYAITVHDELARLIEAVDVVDVCVPTDLHCEMVTAAAAAGRHVICEKPLALTLADAVSMRDACRTAGVQLHVAHALRFFPDYAAARATVDAGGIGRPAVLRLRRTAMMPAASGWFTDPARSGGIVFDLMIHDLDYARWVAGDVVRVFARIRAPREGGAPTRAYAILTHVDGALSHLESTWGLPGAKFTTSFELAGSGGILEHDATVTEPLHIDLPAPAGEGGYLPPLGAGDDPYALELSELAAAISGGPAPRVTPDDGIAAVRIALAVGESARTGRAVELSQEVAR